MTKDEAIRQVKAAFPGKRFFLSSQIWTREEGKTEEAKFDICVYLHEHCRTAADYVSGSGPTIEDAVKTVLEQTPAKLNTEEMFNQNATAREPFTLKK